MAKKTCRRCQKRVSERAARCRHCGYYFPEKSSPWSAGPSLSAGFPLVMVGVLTLFLAGGSTVLVVAGAVMAFAGGILAFHPR